jgi:hypothetical protein
VTGDRGWTAVAAAGAVLVIGAALAIAGVFGGGDEEPAPAAEDFGAATETQATVPAAAPAQPRVKRIGVGGSPDVIAAGAGYVWVGDSLAGTLKRLQPQSLRPVEVQAAGFPTDVSAGEGGAWLALPDRGAVQRVTVQGAAEPAKLRGADRLAHLIKNAKAGCFAEGLITQQVPLRSHIEVNGEPFPIEGVTDE